MRLNGSTMRSMRARAAPRAADTPADVTRDAVLAVSPSASMDRVTSLDDLPIRDDLRGRTPVRRPAGARAGRAQRQREHASRSPRTSRTTSSLARRSHPAPQPVPRPRVHRAPRRPSPATSATASTPEQLWAANGSNEVLQQILQAFGGPGRSVLGFAPTYSMHATHRVGHRHRVDRRRARRRLRAQPRDRRRRGRASTTPTSCSSARRTTPRARRSRSRRSRPSHEAARGIVVVDEAYVEFADPARRAR